MTNSAVPSHGRSRASWPVAIFCGFGGVAYTSATATEAIAASRLAIGGFGGLLPRLVLLAALIVAVFVARALPRRARAAFITGLVVPAVVAAGLLALVIYNLATDPNAFTF